MGIYDNRKNALILTSGCGCNKTSSIKNEDEKPVVPSLPVKPVEPEKPISPKCWAVKPTHIMLVGNKVFITLDDCSYMEADASILDASVCKGMVEDLSKLQEKMNTLSEELDKKANTEEVDKSLDSKANKEDLTKAVTALVSKADKTDVQALLDKVTTLETKTKVLDALEDIQDSDGNVSFRAFPKQ